MVLLFIHLDSAVVRNGKVYAAHSNWRRLPITSSIEVWDARTLEHIETYSFGRAGLGSFTWFDYHDGGSWGPDGYLYLTGHDLPEVYKVQLPEAGSVLEVVEIIPLEVRGRGIAWDRHDRTILYGIVRATDEEEQQGVPNKVVVFQSNIPANVANNN